MTGRRATSRPENTSLWGHSSPRALPPPSHPGLSPWRRLHPFAPRHLPARLRTHALFLTWTPTRIVSRAESTLWSRFIFVPLACAQQAARRYGLAAATWV